jgi:hypothetical protein
MTRAGAAPSIAAMASVVVPHRRSTPDPEPAGGQQPAYVLVAGHGRRHAPWVTP